LKITEKYLEKGKRNIIIRITAVIICSVIIFLMVYNNSSSYSSNIGKIQDISDSGTTQSITAKVQNGKNKGKIVHVTNKYDSSLVYDDKYSKGDFVFLSNSNDEITGAKRDYIVVGAILLLFGLLIIFGGKQGSFTCLCLIINVAVFAVLMNLYLAGWDILGLSIGASIIFTFFVLLFICGFKRNLVIAFTATLVSTCIVGILALILIWASKDLGYEFLDFLPEPYTIVQANHFFLAQIIIGCLGAIMDVAVTITACSTEIIKKTPTINVKQLVSSVREVADDITGTMINVVFFTNVAAIIPIFMVSMCNDINFSTVIRYDAYFDIARFLTGAIGILIAIPISVFAASLFLNGGKRK